MTGLACGSRVPLLFSSPSTDLKRNAANGQVATVLQHVEVLRHQGRAVDQAVGRLGVVASLAVFPRHVLQPRQAQVRRVLVALCNPGDVKKKIK